MKIIWLYFKNETLQMLRIPFATVASLGFPALFFLLMGLPNTADRTSATLVMVSFTLYAVIGIAVNQFGVSLAADRSKPWEKYVRILPVSLLARFAARILLALFFSLLAVSIIILLAFLFSPANLSAGQWLPFIGVLLGGSIPFALMGLTIGYWLHPKAALPLANIVNFILAFVGGLWLPPQELPAIVNQIAPYTPTRQYGTLAWAIISNQTWQASSWFVLLAYALLFGLLSFWGYRRYEGEHYT